jgi:hypothetical protein
MRSSAQAAQRPASTHRGNRNHNTRAAALAAKEAISIAQAPRKKHETRFLFYTLSDQARAEIQELDQGGRYAKAKDIEVPVDDHNKIIGPLRPEAYHRHLCALQKQEGSGIHFQSMRQIGYNRFVPAHCGDNDELQIAACQALGNQA